MAGRDTKRGWGQIGAGDAARSGPTPGHGPRIWRLGMFAGKPAAAREKEDAMRLPGMPYPRWHRMAYLVAVLLGPGAATAHADTDPCDPGRFVLHGNGTVTDSASGLMLKVCSERLFFNDGECSADPMGANPQAPAQGTPRFDLQWALIQPDKVNAGAERTQDHGHMDWRVPTIAEKRSLVNRNCANPALPRTVFPWTRPVRNYWTSSRVSGTSNFWWTVDITTGEARRGVGRPEMEYANHLRLVRGTMR